MPALDYQHIIQSKGLPTYEDLLRHQLTHPASSLVRIWLETTGMGTLDHFRTHNMPGSSACSHGVADNASEPANPVQEVECSTTQSSDQASMYSGMFSMLPRRMTLFSVGHTTTSIPTTEKHEGLSEDDIQVAGTEHVIHIARGLSVNNDDDDDDDDDNDAIPPPPISRLYATRSHHHDAFCCCLLCMATQI